jgi:uncharacterized protein DUF3302
MSYVLGAVKEHATVLQDYIRKLSDIEFWLSKWLMAVIMFGAVLLIGLIFLMTRNLDFDTFLNYFALGLLVFVVITLFYAVIAIHDVPYEIAKHRDHPHQDAIHAAGWVSLFMLHALWPFLWIWAMTYRPDRGWGFSNPPKSAIGEAPTTNSELEELRLRVVAIERLLKPNET